MPNENLHDDSIEYENTPDAIREFLAEIDSEVERGSTHTGEAALRARDDVRITVTRMPDDQWWILAEADRMRPLSVIHEQPERVVAEAEEWLAYVED